MGMSARLAELLRVSHVPHERIQHPAAFRAEEVAAASQIPTESMAKVVCLRDAEGEWVMAVIPAPKRLDLKALKDASGRRGLRLASEEEVIRRFPEYEPGAIPPFALLHQIPVFLDDDFDGSSYLYVEDGSHRGLVGLKVPDYIRLATPTIAAIAHRGH